MIRGNELHVNRLTLDKGEVDIDGRIGQPCIFRIPQSIRRKTGILPGQAVPLMDENVFRRIFLLWDHCMIFCGSCEECSLTVPAWYSGRSGTDLSVGKVFLLMFHESNGNLRWFAVLGHWRECTCITGQSSLFCKKYVALARIPSAPNPKALR